MLRSSATSYYHADGLGSITSQSSAAGSIANTYTYDSFGKLTASTGSLVNPFRYTARESDTETGLYYYRARYYDPNVGRFLSEDPDQFSAGNNFYPYVESDPEDWGDPDGTQRDRRTAARPEGTPDPFKKLRPDPDDPNKVIYKDPHTGKESKKAKPDGFDDYWKKKHPQPQPKPEKCPRNVPKPEPERFVDLNCHFPGETDCVPSFDPFSYPQPFLLPTPAGPIPWRITLPFRFPVVVEPVFAW